MEDKEKKFELMVKRLEVDTEKRKQLLEDDYFEIEYAAKELIEEPEKHYTLAKRISSFSKRVLEKEMYIKEREYVLRMLKKGVMK